MNDYKLTVGLEVHAELNTRTKMFCDSKNDADETRPNVNICPVCMGHPGTLPVINKKAVESVLRFGVAVGGELAEYTEFDRKNYFYPDIPKGYQISQYKHPLVKGGELAGVTLTRVHLEEDTAKSTHDKGEESLVDFNRAGVPLMELVTEPVIHSAEEAARFAKELQLLLITLGIAEANMEKGEMRVEANISVSNQQPTTNNQQLGTKVEVKNLNSFRAVEKAIKFEMMRHIELLEKGEKVVQETRGWDENAGETFSQRAKEDSHDYRYFPDPDLPKLFLRDIPDFAPEALRRAMPELPWEKRERLLKLGITDEHAEIYVTQPEWGSYFEIVWESLEDKTLTKLASNYITSDLQSPVEVTEFVQVLKMVSTDEISSRGAKEILKTLSENGGSAREIAEKKNLMQVSDENILRTWLEEVIGESGREVPSQFIVGQVMKVSGGRANPVLLQKLLVEMLDR